MCEAKTFRYFAMDVEGKQKSFRHVGSFKNNAWQTADTEDFLIVVRMKVV
jgi:hypothetical protein